jgi:hypothetical protein
MVKSALPKGWITPDGAIRGHVECNNCSGRDLNHSLFTARG